MNYREIPETAIEVQPGLWANAKTITMGSLSRVSHDLYSAEGYCFYITEANLDENGDLFPEDDRIYLIFASSAYQTIDAVNANVVSVPYVPSYEIASAGQNHETA